MVCLCEPFYATHPSNAHLASMRYPCFLTDLLTPETIIEVNTAAFHLGLWDGLEVYQ